ncbi:MAG: O-antigen ligase family protein [bacterium]
MQKFTQETTQNKKAILKLDVNYLLFSAYLFGIVLFSRNFAHLEFNISGIPLYTTEFVIMVMLFILFKQGRIFRKLKFKLDPVTKWLFVLYVIAAISLFRGLIAYNDKVFVLRQSAIIYYSIFYFLTPIIINSEKKINFLFNCLFLAALLIVLNSMINFNSVIGAYKYYYLGLAIIMEIIYIILVKTKYKKLLLLVVFLQLIYFILEQVRASWVGMGGVLFFAIVLIRSYLKSKFLINRIIVYCLIGIMGSTCLLWVIKPKLINSVYSEVLSIILLNTDDNLGKGSVVSARWRLFVWKDIIEESLEKPILGWGFGNKFIPKTIKKLDWGGSWKDDSKGFQDPHNSFLSILHRTGFAGLSVFIILVIAFIKRSIGMIRYINDNKMKAYYVGLLLCVIFVLGNSFFAVVLEGPFMGIFLWICMGLMISLERINRKLSDINTNKY